MTVINITKAQAEYNNNNNKKNCSPQLKQKNRTGYV